MAEVAAVAGFPKSRRLLKRGEFLRAQRQAVGVRAKHLVLLYFVRGDDGPSRLGIAASRKMGNAVARNRAKRRIREWFRNRDEPVPPGVDIVIIPAAGATSQPWPELCAQLEWALGKARAKWGPTGGGKGRRAGGHAQGV